MTATVFDVNCRRCPRLAGFLDDVKIEHPDYYCLPVPPFGPESPALLVVGLAPGKHGANATGRAFTGDHAGILLYETLYKFGFATKPASEHAEDDLRLSDCRIVNAVKCLPPANKPVAAEVNACNDYLSAELKRLSSGSVVLALGGVAHKAIVRAVGLRQADYRFGHEHEHSLGSLTLVNSYHCSRYNTNTNRLTTPMFEAVFKRCRELVDLS